MTTEAVLLDGAGLRQGRSLALEAAALAAAGGAGPLAVIIEGGPGTFHADPGVELIQLAAGCACCIGQLPMRVAVARVLRRVRPVRLWIEVASAGHLPELRRQLAGPGFAGHLRFGEAGEDEGAATGP